MDTAMLRSIPALGASLAAAIVVGGVTAQLSPVLHQTLGLTAARAISRPWTLLTCAFTQPNILCSLASALAVLFLTRIVEPAHGPRELAKYLAAVIVLSSCLTVAVVTILYYASATSKKSPAKADSAGFMLFKPMGGFEAGLAALLVAVKQLLPDNEVAILGGALSFSAKHLPGLYAVAMVAASLLLGGAVRVIPFTLFGTYLSWAYLRFVQSRNGARGDLSEEFRFATFFPGPLQPPVDKLAAACTRVTGLGASTGSTQPQAAWNYAMGGSVLPGTEDSDAARRRERGAKALEERLGFKKAVPAAAPPQPPAAASSTKEAGQPAEAAAADIEAAVAPAADP